MFCNLNKSIKSVSKFSSLLYCLGWNPRACWSHDKVLIVSTEAYDWSMVEIPQTLLVDSEIPRLTVMGLVGFPFQPMRLEDREEETCHRFVNRLIVEAFLVLANGKVSTSTSLPGQDTREHVTHNTTAKQQNINICQQQQHHGSTTT